MNNRALIDIMRREATWLAAQGASMASEAMNQGADALEAQEWQSIETAPRDGTEVLLADPTGSFEVASWYGDLWFSIPPVSDFVGTEVGWEPTHWMPLPPPPVSD